MMSSRHLGQYEGNFYIMDEALTANLPPTKALVTRMGFQIVPFSYRWFSYRSTLVCVFKCLRFYGGREGQILYRTPSIIAISPSFIIAHLPM